MDYITLYSSSTVFDSCLCSAIYEKKGTVATVHVFLEP